MKEGVPRSRVWWGLLIMVMGGITVAFMREASLRPAGELPLLGDVRDFTLKDQSHRPLSRKDLLGKTWVADFIYTDCPDQCIKMSRGMAEIQSMLPKESDLQLLSISVNPAKDRPDVLRAYANRFRADGSRWHFLTGKPETIQALAQDFKLSPPRRSLDTTIDHSTRLILVDPASHIRGYYEGTDPNDVQRLIKDLSQLAPQMKNR